MRGYARKPLWPATESRGSERFSSYSYLVRHLNRRVLGIFCLTPRMSYGRRQTTDAKLADTLSKTERLAAVGSIRLVRLGHCSFAFHEITAGFSNNAPFCCERMIFPFSLRIRMGVPKDSRATSICRT